VKWIDWLQWRRSCWRHGIIFRRRTPSGLTGKLRVAAAVTFTRIHLMPRLPEFLRRHPDLEIDVVLDDRNIDLIQEGIDVAYEWGNLPTPR
jgi:DNA-binding transcriptional LysR family regulator